MSFRRRRVQSVAIVFSLYFANHIEEARRTAACGSFACGFVGGANEAPIRHNAWRRRSYSQFHNHGMDYPPAVSFR